jgi:hypothetical protein
MGMTLWIHTLEGRTMSKESDDHSFMHRLSDELDALGTELGVGKLSYYFDFTDMNYNMGDEFDDEEAEDGGDDEPAIDPETGYGYGIDDMKWFDAARGMNVIRELRDAVAAGKLPELDAGERKELLWELDNCARVLEGPAERGAKFHLSVVM